MLPMLFLGHGSPMNAISENSWTRGWQQAVAGIKPKAILMISAHWDRSGLRVQANAQPKTIHDFGGFPPALFAKQYPAPGSAALTALLLDLLADFDAVPDDSWGLDHGAWSVLCHTFPAADIPVVQLSVDSRQTPAWHLAVGQKLTELRTEGVLILASGNIVHNLQLLDWQQGPAPVWAQQFLNEVQALIAKRDWEALSHYRRFGQHALLSVPHPDHLLPLFYLLGAASKDEQLQWFNQDFTLGNLSMHSLKFSPPG